jgi:hypothetical protein
MPPRQEPVEAPQGGTEAVQESTQPVEKPKRVLSEEQLRNLARGRKLALEARKARAMVRAADKIKATEEFAHRVEEAKATIVKKFTPKSPENDEPERPKAVPVPAKKEPSAKDRYYTMKLQALEAQMAQHQAQAQYAAAPPRVHAYDVARGALKAKADRQVYEQVYRDLFGP